MKAEITKTVLKMKIISEELNNLVLEVVRRLEIENPLLLQSLLLSSEGDRVPKPEGQSSIMTTKGKQKRLLQE